MRASLHAFRVAMVGFVPALLAAQNPAVGVVVGRITRAGRIVHVVRQP